MNNFSYINLTNISAELVCNTINQRKVSKKEKTQYRSDYSW